MSKERLEEIKHFVDLIKYIPRDDRGMGEMDVINVQEDMKWLIEQAEQKQSLETAVDFYQSALRDADRRVQELEDRLARIRFINNDYDKQNKRYKQALEFYISYVVNQADVKWLINRVEELEEALMFYADEETYETKFATDTDEICDSFTLIELDEGKKARKVLEGNSDE